VFSIQYSVFSIQFMNGEFVRDLDQGNLRKADVQVSDMKHHRAPKR